MTREGRTKQARRLVNTFDSSARALAVELAKKSSYTFDECFEHLKAALVDEAEKLLGGAR